jgi:hypothetical protein
MIDQFSFQRVHVHVMKFFHSFLQTPNIEIVEAALPEARQRIIAVCKCQTELPVRLAFFAAQAARDALLQNLNHGGRRAFGGLADEQVNVIGHNDIAHQRETVAIARLAENLDENISGANGAQQRQASIASEGDEMKMPVPVVANEFADHGKQEKSNARPSNSGRVGHPEKPRPERQNQFLGDDVLEWYYPTVRNCQLEKKRGRVCHPPMNGNQPEKNEMVQRGIDYVKNGCWKLINFFWQ